MNPENIQSSTPPIESPPRISELLTNFSLSVQNLRKKFQTQKGTSSQFTTSLEEILKQLEKITEFIIQPHNDKDTLKSSSSSSQVQEIKSDIERNSKQFKNFYGKDMEDLVSKILKVKKTQEKNTVRLIYKILRCLLRLFCHEIDYDNHLFSQNVKEIFNHDQPYYSYPYNNLEELDSGGLEQEYWVEALRKAIKNRDLDKLVAKEEIKKPESQGQSTDETSAAQDSSSKDQQYSKAIDPLYTDKKQQVTNDKNQLTISDQQRKLNQQFSMINLQAWYDSLSPGTFVDALKIDQHMKAVSWSRARLKSVKKENHMRLEFLNDSEIRQQEIMMRGLQNTVLSSNAEIAPIGTRCLDFEWRENLKQGDIVDCFDTSSVWYRSTILKKFQKVSSLGTVKKTVIVAYRVYCENGPKTDSDGRKYMGWHNKYDEELSVHNPRIQKLDYMSKIWTDHSTARGFNDDNSKIEDSEDVGRQFGCEQIDSQLFALIRKNSLKSKIFVALINYFGRLGGYSKLLKRIQNQQNPTTFQLLSHYTQMIGSPKSVYSKRFVMKYVNILRVSIPQQTLAMMRIPKLIRQLRRQRMQKLEQSYSSLLSRIYVNEDRLYYFQRLSLDLRLLWIKSEFMDKRIFGVKFLQQYSRKARLYKQQALQGDELIEWIMQHQIIEQIFNPIRTHQQLIKRSMQILKLFSYSHHYTSSSSSSSSSSLSSHASLFNTGYRSQQKKKIQFQRDPFEFILQQMWVCVEYNNQYKVEIYKVIKQAQTAFNSEQNDIIVKKLSKIDIDNMITKDVELITQMMKTQTRLSQSSMQCAKKIWQLAFKKQANKELRQTSIKNIGDILKTYEWRKHRLDYVNNCVQMIKDKTSINVVFKIFEKILDSYSTLKSSQASMYQSYTRFSLIQMLDKEHGLTQAVFDEFIDYYDRLIKLAGQSRLLSDTYVVQDGVTHSQNIEARIRFIKFVYSNSIQLKMTYMQIQTLWTMMIQRSPIETDRDLLLKLFKQEADHYIKHDSSSVLNMTSVSSVQNMPILDIDDLIKIYRDIIENIKIRASKDGEGSQNTLNLDYIRDEGFKFLQNLFIFVNEQEQRLIKVEVIDEILQFTVLLQQKKVYQNNTTLYGHAYTQSSSEAESSSSELFFKVYSHPSSLQGIEIFWRIMLDAIDGEYASRAQNIIIRAFTVSLIFNKTFIQSLSYEIQHNSHSLYRQLTDKCMKLLQEFINMPSQTSSRKEIIRILQMISSIMRESERNGVGSVRPHSGLLRERIITLKIHNNCTTTKQIPKTFLLRLYSNTTISQIRNELSKILRTTSKDLRIVRTRGSIQIDEHDNAKTLNDMEFEQTSQSLVLSRRASISAEHTPLLNLNKKLSSAAKKIFTSWFEQYADVINQQTGEKQMTRKGAAMFTSSCTHQKCYQSDSRISILFARFNIQKDKNLTLDNFLQFYREKALTHDHVVWNNLNYKGYGSDLTKGNNSGTKIVEQDLPRVFIVQNLDYFKLLFKVQQNTDIQISNAAWSLINQLATSKLLYQQILNLDVDRDKQIGMLQWDQFFSTQNAAQLLYTLQIIEFFIEQPPSLGQATMQITDQTNNKEQQQPQDEDKSKSDYQQDEQDAVRLTDIQSATQKYDNNKYKTPPPPNKKKGSRRKMNRQMKANKYLRLINTPQAIPLPDAQHAQQTDAYMQSQQGEQQKWSNDNKSDNNNTDEKQQQQQQQQQQNIPIWTYSGISANADILELSARKDWRLKFFQQSGFTHLFQMLMERKFYSNQRLLDTHSSQTKFVLKGLGSLIRIIKIYLTAALSASSDTVHDVVAMVRRSSSANQFQQLAKQISTEIEVEKENDELEAVEQQGYNDEEQKAENQVVEFQQLIGQLKGSAAQQLLMLVNFKKFQNEIITILAIIVNGRKDMNFQERSIIQSGLSLWVNCIIFRPSELFQSFITQYGDKNNKEISSVSPFYSSQAFILQTLFTYKSHLVRKQFMMTYYTICKSIPLEKQMEIHPLIYFLKLLIASIPREYNILRRECKDFYELLRLLIEEYYQQQQQQKQQTTEGSQIIDADSLIIQVLDSFHQYQPKEKRNSMMQDQTLIGFLELLKTIADKSPNALKNKHGEQLLIEAFQGCLFPSEFKQLKEDVTENLDLNSSALTPHKCKTKQSRQAAFQLLHSLSTISIPMMSEVLDMLFDTIKRAPSQTSWGFSASNKIRSTQGFVGIQNLGCICYMIAMLQQFYMIPPLRYNILQTDDNVAPDMKQYKGRLEDDNIIHQLQRMFCNLQLSEKRAYNPIGFCFAFKDFEGNPTNTGVQQDAQQFLNMAFDRLQNLLKGTRSKYLLPCVFGGSFCQQLTCKSCQFVKTNYQSFYNLSLEVKDIPGLYKSLDKFIVGESIQDYLCENCSQKAQVTKKTSIASLPNVLIIHLQRIVFNFDTFNNDKISTRFEFPKTLDLKRYTLDHLNEQEFLENQKKKQQKPAESRQEEDQYEQSNQEGKQQEKKQQEKKQQEKKQEKKGQSTQNQPNKNQPKIVQQIEPEVKQFKTYEEDPCYEYKLVGVVVHQGSSAEHGHYISFINTSRGDPYAKKSISKYYDEKWLEFNDQTVRSFSISSLQSQCFGSNSYSSSSSSPYNDQGYYTGAHSSAYSDADSKRCAYMLVYERARKKDIKLSLTKQQADIVLNKQKERKQLLENEKSTLKKLQMQQAFQKNYQSNPVKMSYDQKEKEYVQQINFYSTPRFVPIEKANEIWKENNEFLFFEYYLYSQEFFDFVTILADKCWSKIQNQQQEVKLQMGKNDSDIKMLDQSLDNSRTLITPEASQQILRKLMHICYIGVFRLLARTTNNNQIVNLSATLCKILGKDGALAHEFMNECILNAEGSLGAATFVHQLLLQSPDKQTRSNVAKIIAACVNSLFNYEASYLFETEVVEQTGANSQKEKTTVPKALCIRYMNLIISMIRKGEIVKNWTRFQDFFGFLASVAQAGQLQKEFMIKNQFVALLLDMYLGPNSPLCPPNLKRDSIGNQYARPNFSQMFTSLMHLLNGLEQKSLAEEKNDSTLQLTQADKVCLFNKSFFKKAIKQSKQVSGKLVPLIVLQCRDNLKNSKTIAKILLNQMNSTNFEEVSGLLEILEPFLLINDQYQLNRIEWIFGFPQPYIRSGNLQSQYDYQGSTAASSLPFLGIYQNPNFIPQAYTFNSPFVSISTSSSSYTTDMFTKRNRQQTCAMFMLISVWRLLLESQVFRDYILSFPPANYDYGSFHDYWIKLAGSFIQEAKRITQKSPRNTAGCLAQSMKDDVAKCIKQWKVKKIQSIEDRQQRDRIKQINYMIDQQYENAIFQRPYSFDYIICRVTAQKKIQEVTKEREFKQDDAGQSDFYSSKSAFNNNNYNKSGSRYNNNNNSNNSSQFVSMVITQYQGEILTPSLPNGNKNFAIEQYQRSRGMSSGGILGNNNTGIGRGGNSSFFQNKLSKANKKQDAGKSHKKNKSGQRKQQKSNPSSTSISGKQYDRYGRQIQHNVNYKGSNSKDEVEQEQQYMEQEEEEDDQQKGYTSGQANAGSESQQQRQNINDFEEYQGDVSQSWYQQKEKSKNQAQKPDDQQQAQKQEMDDDQIVEQGTDQDEQQALQIQKNQKTQKQQVQITKQFKFTRAASMKQGEKPPIISIIQSQPQNVYEIVEKQQQAVARRDSDDDDNDEDIEKAQQKIQDKADGQLMIKDQSKQQQQKKKVEEETKLNNQYLQRSSSQQQSSSEQQSQQQQDKKQQETIQGQLLRDVVYLYRVSFYNGTNESQKIKYSVKPKYPNRKQNLWLPVNEFKCLVNEKYQRHVFHIMKKDPLNNIPQENEFEVIWRIEDHNEASRARRKHNKQKQNFSHLLFPPQEVENIGDNDGNQASHEEIPDPVVGVPPKGQKSCKACTFFMPASQSRCGICDTLQ